MKNKRSLMLSRLSLSALFMPLMLTEGGGEGGGGNGNSNNQPDLASLQAQLNTLQTQLGTVTSERDSLKTKADEAEELKKTDAQKLADKAAEADRKALVAEEKVKETQLHLAVERAARKLNIIDEEAAVRLLDTKSVVYDKEGKPTNVEALLTELIKTKTYLVKQDETNNSRGGSPANPARDRSGNNGERKTLGEAIAAKFGKGK